MSASSRRAQARWVARLLSAVFCAAIALPGVLLIAGRDESRDVSFEFRPPAAPPSLASFPSDWVAFPAAFERWFGDSLGLRSVLLAIRGRVHWYALRSSPSNLMLRGADGVLYPTSSRAIESSAGRCPMTPREVDEWLDAIAERTAFLASRGLAHVVAIAPDKSSVYPEGLPARHRGEAGRRRCDQIAARAEERGMRQFLDLLPALLDEKRRDVPGDPLYYPLGPHWTHRGALAGTLAIHARLRELGVALAPLERDRIEFGPPLDPEIDSYAGRLYLAGALHQSFLDAFIDPSLVATIVHDDAPGRSLVFQRRLPEAPSLIVFHDSFGENARALLASTARRSLWCWRPYDEAALDAMPADALVEIYTERYFTMRLPPRDDPAGAAARELAFDAAEPGVLLIEPGDWRARVREPRTGALAIRSAAVDERLVFPGRGFSFALDLSGLEPGEDHLLSLDVVASGPGRLFGRYPWRNGPTAYAVESQQRFELPLRTGAQRIVVHIGRQRTRDVLEIRTDGEPAVLALGRLEARVVPPRRPSLAGLPAAR